MSEGQSLSLGANYNGVKQSGQQITVVMREALYDGVCKTASGLVPGRSTEPKDAGAQCPGTYKGKSIFSEHRKLPRGPERKVISS